MLFLYHSLSQTNSPAHWNTQTNSPRLDSISSDILLSLATAPLLLGLYAGQNLAKFWQEVGEASEEVFRGERLPILNFPSVATPASNSESESAPNSQTD